MSVLSPFFRKLFKVGRLTVIDSFGVEQPKTKGLVAKLAELKVSGRVVLVAENAPEALFLAARNVPYVHVVDTSALDPVSFHIPGTRSDAVASAGGESVIASGYDNS